ncbi:MAG: Uma2 family endonuclease [Dehalococcoidia bacterium]|nr:Uma2 family endonuclease [Dehalococcoidia bacterium]
MPVSEATFRQLSLEDGDTTWELVCGRLREKPPMTYAHGDVIEHLGSMLISVLPRARFRIVQNHARLRLPGGSYYVPDIAVVSPSLRIEHRNDPKALDAYVDPVPLVVEVWSPSTGDYDARDKVAGYQERGDAEIWLVDPYEHTVVVHRRQPDGTYSASTHARGDTIEPIALPGVRIVLAELFA